MKWSKPTYRTKAGELRYLSCHYGTFRDHHDRSQRVRGFTDLQASEDFGRRVERLVGLRATHQTLGTDLVHWLENLSDYHRGKFATWGMIDDRASSLSRPLAEHLGDYKRDLLANDRTVGYVNTKVSRAGKLIDGAGFKRFRDIDSKSVKLWGKGQRDRGMSKRTWAHYVDAIRSFCQFMVESGRAASSPVQNLRAVQVDDEDVRGVLTRDQLKTLCEGVSGVVYGLDSATRSLIYWTAFETTQRKVTLGEVTGRDLRVKRDGGIVTGGSLRTTQRKGRTGKPRVHYVPLKSALAEALEAHAATKTPDAPLFKIDQRSAVMLRSDLRAAGLSTSDSEGNVLCFHGLRHSGLVWWAESGADIQTLMQISGHKSVRMLDRYLNHRNADAAVRRLDEIDAPAPLKMTGTEASACAIHEIPQACQGNVWHPPAHSTRLALSTTPDRCPRGRTYRLGKPF